MLYRSTNKDASPTKDMFVSLTKHVCCDIITVIAKNYNAAISSTF